MAVMMWDELSSVLTMQPSSSHDVAVHPHATPCILSMMADLRWEAGVPMVLVGNELIEIADKWTPLAKELPRHPIRIDRPMIFLQQLPGFTRCWDHGYLTDHALAWADELYRTRDERWWKVFPVFFYGDVEVRVRQGETGWEMHREGHVIRGRLGAWVTHQGLGSTTVGDREVQFTISSRQENPELIAFVSSGMDRSAV